MKRIVKYAAVMALAGGMPWLVMAQPYLVPKGAEYRIGGSLPGDQTHPQAAINRDRGILVWQDNASTNGALRAKLLRLDSNLTATGPVLAVDEFASGDQENPQTVLLSGGNALVVWQGGQNGTQKIYSQVVDMTGPDASPATMVNTYTNSEQITPSVAALPDGSAFVAWASRDQDGGIVNMTLDGGEKGVAKPMPTGMLGIYARRISATGEPIGDEIQVNQFKDFNQRSPDVAVLNNGTVLVSWISEQQRRQATAVSQQNPITPEQLRQVGATLDVYGRLFSGSGAPLSNEFLMSDSAAICANPTVNGTADGGIILAWSQKDLFQPVNGWDIYARLFGANGQPKGPSFLVNSTTYGDQYKPNMATAGSETLVVWTAMNAQDGDWEGVFGQYVDATGQKLGAEFQVNTSSSRSQLEPAVVSDGYRHILAVWTSYIAGEIDFELMAQQFISTQVDAEIKLTLAPSPEGLKLNWNTEAGTCYQVQYSHDFVLWKNLSTPRFASGSGDSIIVNATQTTSFYRVVQLPKVSN